MFDYVSPEDKEETASVLRQLTTVSDEPKTIAALELRLKTARGAWVAFEAAGKSIQHEDGHVEVVVNCRDISERKRYERDVHLLAAVVEQSAEPTVITDCQGSILYVNSMCEKTSGYTGSEVIGQTSELFKPNLHEPIHYHQLWTLLSAGKVWSGQLTKPRKDGTEMTVHVTAFPVHDPSGSTANYVSIERDVSAQARMESQLRESQKLEAIGTLAGGIAHDFNNILSAIMGYTEFVMQDLPEDGMARQDLDQVLQGSRRARDLIRQLLTFSRQQEYEKQSVYLDLILKEALKLVRSSLPSTIEIGEDVRLTNASVHADPTQMHQIFMNLCTNAFHAMRDTGGTLSVSLEEVELDYGHVQAYPDLSEGNYVRIVVSDTGQGMDRHTLSRIFEPFFTTKREEGTGLGLSTVLGIVKSHGGAVTVYSEPGSGSSFHIYLPKHETPVAETQDKTDVIPRGNGETVLLVDDEPSLVDLGKRILTRLGYDVFEMHNSLDAIEAFREDPDAFDLIVSDQTMPNLPGHELARAAKEIRPNIPIVLTTGFSEILNDKLKSEVGSHATVMKPLILKDLATVVHSALHGDLHGEPGS